MRNRITATLGILAACALAATAPAASLRLSDGTLVRVSVLPAPVAALGHAVAEEQPLVFTMVEPSGRVQAGAVPGSLGVAAGDVALAQNPVTGDVMLAFARPGRGGHDIVGTTWTGLSWTDPLDLATTDTDETMPLLTFRSGGDALLAWISRRHGTGTVLLRHVDFNGVEPRTYSFSDVGSLEAMASELVARGGHPRLLHVIGGVESLAAYLLVGDASGAPAAVARVTLDAIVDPGGLGAAPVPVTFGRTLNGSGGGGGITGRANEGSGGGEILAPWRIVLGRGEAWYWAESDRAQLVTVIDGAAGSLVGFDRPGSEAALHVAAFGIARNALGVGFRRASSDSSVLQRRER